MNTDQSGELVLGHRSGVRTNGVTGLIRWRTAFVNGHVRRDIGAPFWLSSTARGSLLSVGILERDTDESAGATSAKFDRIIETRVAQRPDPCKDLAARLPALPAPPK